MEGNNKLHERMMTADFFSRYPPSPPRLDDSLTDSPKDKKRVRGSLKERGLQATFEKAQDTRHETRGARQKEKRAATILQVRMKQALSKGKLDEILGLVVSMPYSRVISLISDLEKKKPQMKVAIDRVRAYLTRVEQFEKALTNNDLVKLAHECSSKEEALPMLNFVKLRKGALDAPLQSTFDHFQKLCEQAQVLYEAILKPDPLKIVQIGLQLRAKEAACVQLLASSLYLKKRALSEYTIVQKEAALLLDILPSFYQLRQGSQVEDSHVAADFIARYKQLKAQLHTKDFEKSEMPLLEILRFALFCQRCIKIKACGVEHMDEARTQLKRPVVVDWTKRTLFVVADSKASSLRAFGGSKQVVHAVRVPFRDLAETAAEIDVIATLAVQTRAQEYALAPQDIEKNAAKTQQALNDELSFHKALDGVPGIAEVRTFTHITLVDKTGSTPKIAVVYKKAHQGSLLDVINKHELSTRTARKGMIGLLTALSGMHERHVLHHDLKEENILVDKDGNFMVSDFGLSLKSDTKLAANAHMRKHNYYPVKWYSAPELLFRDPKLPKFGETASEKELQKVESFSCGAILYHLHHGKPLPLRKAILDHVTKYGYDAMFDEAGKKSMKRVLQVVVEDAYKKLPSEKERTERQHYEFAILSLMRLDPVERWLPSQAKAYLEKTR